jgi:hypothetical protein
MPLRDETIVRCVNGPANRHRERFPRSISQRPKSHSVICPDLSPNFVRNIWLKVCVNVCAGFRSFWIFDIVPRVWLFVRSFRRAFNRAVVFVFLTSFFFFQANSEKPYGLTNASGKYGDCAAHNAHTGPGTSKTRIGRKPAQTSGQTLSQTLSQMLGTNQPRMG